jgi:hypothetical protein
MSTTEPRYGGEAMGHLRMKLRHLLLAGGRAALAGLVLMPITPGAAAAEEPAAQEARPHHLSVVLAGTRVPEAEETGFTIGLDYEYRVSELIGLGFVVEHAFGEIDSTTLLAVADIHLIKGLAIQAGPGVEFVDDESVFVFRLGLLYEFELGEAFTLSPQLHYDISAGEDAIVFGVAIGRAF